MQLRLGLTCRDAQDLVTKIQQNIWLRQENEALRAKVSMMEASDHRNMSKLSEVLKQRK